MRKLLVVFFGIFFVCFTGFAIFMTIQENEARYQMALKRYNECLTDGNKEYFCHYIIYGNGSKSYTVDPAIAAIVSM